MPTLSDQYKTGPLEVSLTINATIIIGALRKHNKKTAMIKSKTRFTTIYIPYQIFNSRFPINPNLTLVEVIVHPRDAFLEPFHDNLIEDYSRS
jgi:hypothetical protein